MDGFDVARELIGKKHCPGKDEVVKRMEPCSQEISLVGGRKLSPYLFMTTNGLLVSTSFLENSPKRAISKARVRIGSLFVYLILK